jgi:phage-related protein
MSLKSFFSKVKKVVSAVVEKTAEAASLISKVGEVVGFVSSTISTAAGWVADKVGAAVSFVSSTVSTVQSLVSDASTSIVDKVVGTASYVIGQGVTAYNWAVDTVQTAAAFIGSTIATGTTLVNETVELAEELANAPDGNTNSLAYNDYTGLAASSAAGQGLGAGESQKTLLAA